MDGDAGGNDDGDDRVEIISTQDDRAKIIGEILSNDTSRKILGMLEDEELTLSEISKKSDISLPLATHHVRKMQSVGAVKVSRVGRSTKGHNMNYYMSTDQSFLVVPVRRSAVVRSALNLSRFAAIGLAGLVSWMALRPRTDSSEMRDGGPGDEVQYSDTPLPGDEVQHGDTPLPGDEVQQGDTPPHGDEVQHGDTPSPGDGVEQGDTSPIRPDTDTADWIAEVVAGMGDAAIVPIIVPIAVVGAGIVVERVLTRWHRSRSRR